MPLKAISRPIETNCRLQWQIVRLIEIKPYKWLKEDIR